MKIRQTRMKTCTVNGCDLVVPDGDNYITIDMNGCVEFWSEKPYIDEGRWYHTHLSGSIICTVDDEPGDEWTRPFSVRQNRFLTYSDY